MKSMTSVKGGHCDYAPRAQKIKPSYATCYTYWECNLFVVYVRT